MDLIAECTGMLSLAAMQARVRSDGNGTGTARPEPPPAPPLCCFAISLARTATVATAVGSYSIHRLAPAFFGGYRLTGDRGVKLATPEKALLDVLYLRNARSRLFTRLPELVLPDRFDVREARRWVKRIPEGPRRVMVEQGLEAILGARR